MKKLLLLIISIFIQLHYSHAQVRIEKIWHNQDLIVKLQSYPNAIIHTIDSIFEKGKLIYIHSSIYNAKELLLTYQDSITYFYFTNIGFGCNKEKYRLANNSKIPIADFCTTAYNTGLEIKYYQNKTFECNHLSNTRNGFWVQDYCQTATTDIINNDWSHHYYGILYSPLGQDGTLGDMGSSATDNNFNFAGNYDNDALQANAKRLWRIMIPPNGPPQPAPLIYTNSLTQQQSGSTIAGTEYVPTLTGGLIPACNPTYSIVVTDGGGNGSTVFDIDQNMAIQLLKDSISFYANPSVAKWLAEQRLYRGLDEDAILRASNTLLNTFYTEMHTEPTGYIQQTNRLIGEMLQPAVTIDTLTFANMLAQAQAVNEDNAGGEGYEDAENTINTLYFKSIQLGSQSYTTAEKQAIELLAKSCPLVNGTAVYKARALWQGFEPWINYDDLYICNASASGTANKNSTSGSGSFNFVMQNMNTDTNFIGALPPTSEFDKVQHYVKSINTANAKETVHAESFANMIITPNPAQNQITILYKLQSTESGKVIMYNLLGQMVQTIELNNYAQVLTTTLQDLSPGIYNYAYFVNERKMQTGHLTIIK
jgi:hypothetical protein